MKLQQEFTTAKQKLAEIDEELKNAPSGRLVRKDERYYHSVNRVEAGITTNTDFITRLARKKYLLVLKKALENNMKISTLKSQTVVNCEPNQRINELSPTFQGLPRNYFWHSTVVPWQNSGYKQSTYRLDKKIYETNQGVLVRSKSELIIANLFESLDIPYRYEPETIIKGKKLYPDFVIKKPFTGEEIIWEHFGALHAEDYEERMNQKMQIYLNHGLQPFDTLIYTFEFDITKTRLEKLIKELILSY